MAKQIIGLYQPLNDFVTGFGYNRQEWFKEYVEDYQQQKRIMEIINIKEYLGGLHDINKVTGDTVPGQDWQSRRIVLQYAKRLIEFGATFLAGKSVTLSGDESVMDAIRLIYKTSDYEKKDLQVALEVLRYGNCFEYVYVKNDATRKISSRFIDAADGYPIFSDEGEYISFIEFYTVNGVDFYTVFTPETVTKYSNAGGGLKQTATYSNLSGLPIIHKNENVLSSLYGRSDIYDYKTILDQMELLLSKSSLGLFQNLFGIPVISGQELFTKDDKGNQSEALNPNLVGQGLNIDSDSEFKFVANEFNSDGFEKLYNTLQMALLDVSGTPSVALGKTDISNLSEVSLKLLFLQAELKSMLLAKFLKDSFKVRINKFKTLLAYKGIKFTDEQWDTIDINFNLNMPSSAQDIITNLTKLKEIGALSDESIVKMNPYVTDSAMELEKIKAQRVDTEG